MENNWRVMGLWRGGRAFLVVMGISRKDCATRIARALADYSAEDLQKVESFWYERWLPALGEYDAEWLPLKTISKKRVIAALERRRTGGIFATEFDAQERQRTRRRKGRRRW